MEHLLDQPIWNALISGNKDLALGSENVKYFPKDVSPLAALKAEDPIHLIELLDAANPVDSILLTATMPLTFPEQWKILFYIDAFQMCYEGKNLLEPNSIPLSTLGREHVAQMLELTQLTKPGPFESNTIKLGNYKGIFDKDRLVAMAGQRLKVNTFTEISAVCTHPDYNGKGYSRQLLINQVNHILQANQTPFLHVNTRNNRAVQLYESLGFKIRRVISFYSIQKT